MDYLSFYILDRSTTIGYNPIFHVIKSIELTPKMSSYDLIPIPFL